MQILQYTIIYSVVKKQKKLEQHEKRETRAKKSMQRKKETNK